MWYASLFGEDVELHDRWRGDCGDLLIAGRDVLRVDPCVEALENLE